MGSKRNVDMSATTDTIKVVKAENNKPQPEEKENKKKIVKPKRARSKRYKAVRAQVDKTKQYDPFAAIELVKKLSYGKFDATIEAHLVVRETPTTATLTFPHSTGKSITVAIASENVIQQIEKGNIDFDVLLAKPAFMPKLAKLARVLGPKGLMPNPKNGTLTDKPEDKKKELEAGKLTLKTEKKAPLIHVSIGKTSLETKKLVENIEALNKALKGKLLKMSIAATMSPGVKVEVDKA